MKTLYIECSAGAAGDMIASALAGLLDDPFSVADMVNGLELPGVVAKMTRTTKSGISGLHLAIEVRGKEEDDHVHHHHNHGSTPATVRQVINYLNVSDFVKKNANEIYDLIAEAEADVHGMPVNEVHFHEVGMLDAIADIVCVCMLIEKFAPERIIASPVRTGTGHVKCAHGILPVPAPATERLLRGIPSYAGDIAGEFCTPTGAAILKHFVKSFENMPPMVFDKVGYGLGKRDFPIANIVRIYSGETDFDLPQIAELSCNLDDMTPEDLAAAADAILAAGALDVFITPIIMKKGRPGSMLTCFCRVRDSEKYAGLMLSHTTTIGVRKRIADRYEMASETIVEMTQFGPVKVKKSKGFGIEKEKIEHDDLCRLSKETGLPVKEIRKRI